MNVVFVLTGNRDGTTTPPDPADFANRRGAFAAQMQRVGGAAAYEIWNEEDETDFWGAAVDAARYAAILKAAYPRIKQADPGAKVLLGPLTGNNYNFLGQVYAAGAGGSFDAVGVHTDTACLVDPPSSFYREDGNVARFTFLGFRTVHDVMAANGDGAKPIWMTELGWTTTTLDLRARHVGGPEARRASPRPRRPPTSRRPTTASPAIPTSRPRCGSPSRTPPATATSSTTTACSAPTARTSPPGTRSSSVATQGDQLTGPCGDFDAAVADHQRAGHQRAVRADADHQRRRHRRQQRRAHDLPGRRQGDPQLHRHRRGFGQGRHARLAGREEPGLRARTRSPSSRSTRRATRARSPCRSPGSRRSRRR